jgi:hypothetical protein
MCIVNLFCKAHNHAVNDHALMDTIQTQRTPQAAHSTEETEQTSSVICSCKCLLRSSSTLHEKQQQQQLLLRQVQFLCAADLVQTAPQPAALGTSTEHYPSQRITRCCFTRCCLPKPTHHQMLLTQADASPDAAYPSQCITRCCFSPAGPHLLQASQAALASSRCPRCLWPLLPGGHGHYGAMQVLRVHS